MPEQAVEYISRLRTHNQHGAATAAERETVCVVRMRVTYSENGWNGWLGGYSAKTTFSLIPVRCGLLTFAKHNTYIPSIE